MSARETLKNSMMRLAGKVRSRLFYRRPRYIWSGVYRDRIEDLQFGYKLDGNTFLGETAANTRRILEKAGSFNALAGELKEENIFLPYLVSVLSQNRKNIRILDFGGALGIDYIPLAYGPICASEVEYYVVEQAAMCREGEKIFSGDARIHFCERLPADLKEVDIVYSNSVLQYIKDYEKVVKELCEYRPSYFLIVRLTAGDVDDFVTIQKNIRGTEFACRFFNIGKFRDLMRRCGYDSVFEWQLSRKYDMDNFPEECRVTRHRALLFERT